MQSMESVMITSSRVRGACQDKSPFQGQPGCLEAGAAVRGAQGDHITRAAGSWGLRWDRVRDVVFSATITGWHSSQGDQGSTEAALLTFHVPGGLPLCPASVAGRP